MSEQLPTQPLFILVIGVVMVIAMLAKAGLERIRVPALVGFLLLGLGIRVADDAWALLDEAGIGTLQLLGELGVICILFRVGLENDPRQLASQLPRAISIWIGNVAVSAAAGYLLARYVLDYDAIPSLFVAAALSATSVGVSVLIWESAGRLRSELGQKLIDVAELDDISAVVFMVALFAAAPLAHQGADATELSRTMLAVGAMVLGKALLLGGVCLFFAVYLEKPMTSFFARFERAPDPMIGIVGIGFVIAALAGWLGFSVAVGALFAGLAFSRDPEAVKMESSFVPVYEWLTPFFFIGIGMRIDPSQIGSSAGIGVVLLVGAILGKVVGAGLPTWFQAGPQAAAVMGASMIPRAEIALVVAQTGVLLGDWAVPGALYGAIVFVSAGTCILAPVVLSYLFLWFPEAPPARPPNLAVE